MNSTLDRREFIKRVLLTSGGFALQWTAPHEAQAESPHTFSPNPWVRVEANGHVTILVDKSEMGQGVMTALPMILAEEMDLDWSMIHVEFAPAAPEYAHPWFHTQATGGSTSVRAMWQPLRQAGATARELLRAAAAQQWNLPPEQIKISQGVLQAGVHRATFADMVPHTAQLPVPRSVTLKSPDSFHLIGKPAHRLDSLPKSTGIAAFGLDKRLPGLLTAVVARPAVLGSSLLHYDASAALKQPGVRFVLPVQSPTGQGLAVLADTTWHAMKARDLLHIQWDESAHKTRSTASLRQEMALLLDTGESAKMALQRTSAAAIPESSGVTTLQARYEAPYLAHAPMEPMNCTAWVQPDRVDLWVGTQAQGPNQQLAAQLTGLTPQQVNVHTQFLGGGFGRRFAPDFVTEAVSLSRDAGAPVKVVYTREDDMQAQYYRPMALCQMEAKLDTKGQILHYAIHTACDSIALGTGFESAIIDKGIDRTSVEGLADIPYHLPDFQVRWTPFAPGVRVWFWRSVGHTQNSFFSESFMDEMAHAAGADPFEYRRALLTQAPRTKAVLERVAQESGWGQPLPAGRARGIALVESFGSIVAEVAEVSLEQGQPRVHRVTIAADIGTVVNPDIAAAQMEGAMIYGLGAALYGEITFTDGKIDQSNFHDYPLLRLTAMPQVSVHFVPSSEPPGGVGEPGTPPIAPAVCNALFSLTGKRIRSLPLARQSL